MSYTVIISHRAHMELNTAFEFYIAERPDLGEKFIAELETSLHKISNTPQFFSFVSNQKNYRRLSMKRFPFLIIFKIFTDKVVVLSIHNTHKKGFV